MTIPSEGTALLNGVTSTTSATYNVENFETITIQFTAAGISAGNGVLTLLASNDGGSNYYGIAFVDMASTTTTTAITSKTLSTNTTFMANVPLLGFKMIKVTVAVTTDGNYTVFANGRRTNS